jgi:chromosomal replication initiation ATPase DnaA
LKGTERAQDQSEYEKDERILGGSKFAEGVIREKRESPGLDVVTPEEIIREASEKAGLSVKALLSGSRRSNVAQLRTQLVLQLVDHPRLTLVRIGHLVGISRWGVSKILERKT